MESTYIVQFISSIFPFIIYHM